MRRPLPTTVRLAAAFVAALTLNSLVTQMLLIADHRFVLWFHIVLRIGIYSLLLVGLTTGMRESFWCGIFVSILNLALPLLPRLLEGPELARLMPWWDPIPTYACAVLGLGLMASLLARPTREYFRAQPPGERLERRRGAVPDSTP
jgi:hypothetical protein